MALFVGLAGVMSISKAKKSLETSEIFFWKSIRPKPNAKPWMAYLVAGIAAQVCSIAALVGLSYLNPNQADVSLAETFRILSPWSLISFAVAVITGFNLDRKPSPNKIDTLLDTIYTALAAILAAVVAIFVSAGTLDVGILGKGIYIFFAIPAAALLGGVVGAVVPRHYRQYKAKQVNLDLADINLAQVIQECCDALSERIDKERVKLEVNIDPDLPSIKADSYRLKQALFGLLTNALEYTAPDDQIIVEARSLDDEQVEIKIKDSGIGIKQGRLHRVKDSLKSGGSTSLDGIDNHSPANLLQIKSIIDLHKGNLNLSSTLWEGTTAEVKLPKKIDTIDASSLVA